MLQVDLTTSGARSWDRPGCCCFIPKAPMVWPLTTSSGLTETFHLTDSHTHSPLGCPPCPFSARKSYSPPQFSTPVKTPTSSFLPVSPPVLSTISLYALSPATDSLASASSPHLLSCHRCLRALVPQPAHGVPTSSPFTPPSLRPLQFLPPECSSSPSLPHKLLLIP